MAKKMKLTIDGKNVEGTAEELLELLNRKVEEDNSGPRYWSNAKGWMYVRQMADEHLMNALIKHGKDELENLRGLNISDFYKRYNKQFFYQEPETVVGVLLLEIERRNDVNS